MSANPPSPEICRRIAEIRRELYGNRGKASFCKRLGISPSTYNYYETARVPPADLLVRIADVAGVDLRWLLTGQSSGATVAADHPAVARIVKLLAAHPNAAEPLAAFVDLLAATFEWPAKDERLPGAGAEKTSPRGRTGPERTARRRRDWIPLLGRSAAGVPQFWANEEGGAGVTRLAEIVERHARRRARQVRPAQATDETGKVAEPIQIVTLTAPDADNIAEFIAAAGLKRKYPDAFAVRIDGDSMAPEIRHGDIVICSPSVPPADGHAAVVQLRGQIGVTCKIFRREGEAVHLVPINEQHPPQAYPARELVWAQRVLARIRPGERAEKKP